jgi:hypothetical protein
VKQRAGLALYDKEVPGHYWIDAGKVPPQHTYKISRHTLSISNQKSTQSSNKERPFVLSPVVKLADAWGALGLRIPVFTRFCHSSTCWLPLQLSFQVTSRHSRTIWQFMYEQDSHSKLSERTVTPHTAFRRYLRAGWTQSQICTAAVHRKKRSLSRRVQPDFLLKGYSSTGADSIVTCSAAVITGQQPQASNKKGHLKR